MSANIQILVVEDEKITAELIQGVLKRLGYTISSIVDSGEKAIEAAEDMHPDLVLMDIMLSGEMDGVEAAEQIKKRFNIPVVYLTSAASEDILARAKITEPFGYLVKPYNEKELHATIEMAIFKARMEEQLRKTKQWLAAIIENIGDSVIVLDQDYTISTFNLAAQQLFGYPRSEILGKPFRQLLVRQEIETIIIRRAQTVGKYVAELQMRRKNESSFPAKLHVSTLRDTTNQPSTFIVVVRDLSAEKEIETLHGTLAQTKEYLTNIMKQLDEKLVRRI